MINSVQQSNILAGKRHRVMSIEGVLSVIDTDALKKSHQKKLKQFKKVKQITQKPTQKPLKPQKIEKKPDERVKITKNALQELIDQHFIIIDDEEAKNPQQTKNTKQLVRTVLKKQARDPSSESISVSSS